MAPPSTAGLRSPPAAQAPYFDASTGEWVVSRYRDVMAALREPLFWPAAPQGGDPNSGRDATGRLLQRGPSQDALAHIDEWELAMAPMAERALDRIAPAAPVDLLSAYALPWCLEVALLVVQAVPADAPRLAALGTKVFAATGAPDDSPLKPQAAAATEELVRFFEKGPLPMGEPTFVAVSQTTPRVLANLWLSLYHNPGQADLLRANPSLWPGAADELLRYAGIVRRIRREARGTVELPGVTIAAGDRVRLLLASANRDPAQFPDPDRLDVTRSLSAHVALGMGRNSCVGAALVRSMIAVSTRALLERYPNARLCEEPELRTGSGYCFPTSVRVRCEQ